MRKSGDMIRDQVRILYLLFLWVEPIEVQNIELPIGVEPIEAQNIELPIGVEPIEAQNIIE